ncbi:aminodeoxychorismate lyase [Celerinatantimonas diazotrophica]|uniref:Aminodeoxychorismate lyase n=1 Tax=Celerinatantimonas diazotrophica TaxID=412034 RepID=A0A4R1JBV5_9GAMM|nr:aminodeoxychorismate lyase [Celerinatantimonas diazotrophica]TCK47639.1 aminodeoxychorismate lyase apoprotein [Celerinatantimonas diazotrophica]CAG9296738.1 Aminodeoxychorismate lyase [Celerinatantimonas diazotrophica]
MIKHWVNGQPSDSLPVEDRGLQYGDGFFTTMAVRNGKIQNLDYHQIRISHGLRLLNFSVDVAKIWQFTEQKATSLNDGGLKLTITRGVGGRGYQSPEHPSPNWIISSFALPPIYKEWQEVGVRLALAKTRLAVGNVFSHLKTLNRIEQVALKQELTKDNDELLVLDYLGNVSEAITANVFWRKGKKIYTPELKLAGVFGTQRSYLIEKLQHREFADFELNIDNYPLAHIQNSDEIWLTNSLLPIVPVRQFESKTYQDFSFTQRLLGDLGY